MTSIQRDETLSGVGTLRRHSLKLFVMCYLLQMFLGQSVCNQCKVTLYWHWPDLVIDKHLGLYRSSHSYIQSRSTPVIVASPQSLIGRPEAFPTNTTSSNLYIHIVLSCLWLLSITVPCDPNISCITSETEVMQTSVKII